MGNIGWIKTENYSFDCMLRMERFQIRLMLENLDEETEAAMAAALKANPKTAWLFAQKCPEMAERVKTLIAQAPDNLPPDQVQVRQGPVAGTRILPQLPVDFGNLLFQPGLPALLAAGILRGSACPNKEQHQNDIKETLHWPIALRRASTRSSRSGTSPSVFFALA